MHSKISVNSSSCTTFTWALGPSSSVLAVLRKMKPEAIDHVCVLREKSCALWLCNRHVLIDEGVVSKGVLYGANNLLFRSNYLYRGWYPREAGYDYKIFSTHDSTIFRNPIPIISKMQI